MACEITIYSKQLGKRQDHILSSRKMNPTNGKIYDMIEVYDGHGSDECIDCIRLSNTSDVINNSNTPELDLESIIQQKHPFIPHGSGSTFSCVKIYEDHIECRSIGDSEIWVFINGNIVYKSENHNWSNEKEQLRIKHLTQVNQIFKPFVLSPISITMVETNCVQWKYCREFLNLVPTQSLGHRGITGLEPSVHIIDIQLNDEITVIIGSDGLWDMICEADIQFLSTCSSAEELCKFAEDRWKQEWNYINDIAFPDVMEKTSFDDFDDITVGIYKKRFKR